MGTVFIVRQDREVAPQIASPHHARRDVAEFIWRQRFSDPRGIRETREAARHRPPFKFLQLDFLLDRGRSELSLRRFLDYFGHFFFVRLELIWSKTIPEHRDLNRNPSIGRAKRRRPWP